MWKCKKCGGEIFSIEVDILRTKYQLDKNKEEIKTIGSMKKNVNYAFECDKCSNIAFYENELEDIAEWMEE